MESDENLLIHLLMHAVFMQLVYSVRIIMCYDYIFHVNFIATFIFFYSDDMVMKGLRNNELEKGYLSCLDRVEIAI